jgi:O-antigen/teichoic acid export membrane protein
MFDRLIRGIGANVLSQVAVLVVQFGLVPVMAAKWGLERYGVWLLLSTIPSYLALGDFGFATAAATDMTMKVAREEKSSALMTFQSAWLLIVCISVLLSSIIFVVVLLLPDSVLASKGAESSHSIRMALAILLLYSLLCLQGGIIQAGFRCSGNYASGVALQAMTMLIEGGVAVATVLFGASIIGVALGYLLCRLLALVVQASVMLRIVPWLSFGFAKASTNEIKRLWRPAMAVMVLPMAQATFLQGTAVMVGWAVSAAAVPIFTTARTLSRTGIQLTTLLNHAIMPELSIATSRGDDGMKKQIVILTFIGSLAVILPFGLGLLAFGKPFIGIWTRGVIETPFSLIVVMSAVTLINGLWHPMSNLLLAINRQETYSYVFLSTALVTTALAYPFCIWLGPTGAACSLLCLDVFMAQYVFRRIGSIFFERVSFGEISYLFGQGLERLRQIKILNR